MVNRSVLLCCLFLMTGLLAQAQPIQNWEFAQREFGGTWELWRNIAYEGAVWSPVTVPHCFNARDAVDPYVKYYQGEGWYRTGLDIQNPYPQGRTLLHFEGVGQKARVYVYQTPVGFHQGGYDEFTIDLTDAVANYRSEAPALPRKTYGTRIPVAVCADNTRDLNSIPSDLSDFNLYGGMYRKVHLRYVPAISLERVHIASEVNEAGDLARLLIKPLIYNPTHQVSDLEISVKIKDSAGQLVAEAAQRMPLSSAGEFPLSLEDPALWSPGKPELYTCEVSLVSEFGTQELTETFGIRSFFF
ncbi:MAG: sugar-binding domain-containing protein, partial [Bacteroidota bacterium]